MQNTIKYTPLILLLVLVSCNSKTDQSGNGISENPTIATKVIPRENQELYDVLKEKDSLLFQLGFNQIDTTTISSLVSQDFEFYHDLSGVTSTKAAFIQNISSIGDLPFKTWRTLVTGSMEVFPLYENNGQVLYGAIQSGVHDFYQQQDGVDAHKTSTAQFTHLWTLENGDWKLKRVLSYDHKTPVSPK
jgi:hypothetical protein